MQKVFPHIDSSAVTLKAALLDFLLKKYKSSLYGNEVFFGSKMRAADIISVGKNITAFEVKSSTDDFRKLNNQLVDYVKVFDFVYVVLAENKLNEEILLTIPTNVGILGVKKNHLVKIRNAEKNSLLEKKEILSTVPSFFLKQFTNEQSNMAADEVRNELEKYSLEKIKTILKKYLIQKLTCANKVFREERGRYTHVDDIQLLNIRVKISL